MGLSVSFWEFEPFSELLDRNFPCPVLAVVNRIHYVRNCLACIVSDSGLHCSIQHLPPLSQSSCQNPRPQDRSSHRVLWGVLWSLPGRPFSMEAERIARAVRCAQTLSPALLTFQGLHVLRSHCPYSSTSTIRHSSPYILQHRASLNAINMRYTSSNLAFPTQSWAPLMQTYITSAVVP